MSRISAKEIIISVLAVVSIALVAAESLMSLSKSALMAIYITDLIICIVFAADFIQRLIASESKKRFFKTNGYEILAMFPAIAFYALGTIPAIAMAFRALRFIRLFVLLARMRRVISTTGRFFQRSNLVMMFGITVAVIFIGAYAALVLDSGTENARITNFPDAVWWSISTVTTVGYGDVVPSSTAGRIMGMGLMVVGIGVMAAFISQVSATLVESRLKPKIQKDNLKTAVISEIKDKLDNIDKLSDSDMSLLLNMIQTLRTKGE